MVMIAKNIKPIDANEIHIFIIDVMMYPLPFVELYYNIRNSEKNKKSESETKFPLLCDAAYSFPTYRKKTADNIQGTPYHYRLNSLRPTHP